MNFNTILEAMTKDITDKEMNELVRKIKNKMDELEQLQKQYRKLTGKSLV
jgi:hypothetical protein